MIAIWRRAGIPEEDRFNITPNSKIQVWNGNLFSKILAIMLIVSILCSLGMLGYYIGSPAVEPFTEFYMLDANGESQNYPVKISAGDEAEVILVIVNRELENANYRIEITIEGTIYNETGSIFFDNNEKWEDTVSFSINRAGNDQKVEFLLSKNDQPDVYRSNHLWVDLR